MSEPHLSPLLTMSLPLAMLPLALWGHVEKDKKCGGIQHHHFLCVPLKYKAHIKNKSPKHKDNFENLLGKWVRGSLISLANWGGGSITHTPSSFRRWDLHVGRASRRGTFCPPPPTPTWPHFLISNSHPRETRFAETLHFWILGHHVTFHGCCFRVLTLWLSGEG